MSIWLEVLFEHAPEDVRRALEADKALTSLLASSLAGAAPAAVDELPETLEAATREEVIRHFLFELARLQSATSLHVCNASGQSPRLTLNDRRPPTESGPSATAAPKGGDADRARHVAPRVSPGSRLWARASRPLLA